MVAKEDFNFGTTNSAIFVEAEKGDQVSKSVFVNNLSQLDVNEKSKQQINTGKGDEKSHLEVNELRPSFRIPKRPIQHVVQEIPTELKKQRISDVVERTGENNSENLQNIDDDKEDYSFDINIEDSSDEEEIN